MEIIINPPFGDKSEGGWKNHIFGGQFQNGSCEYGIPTNACLLFFLRRINNKKIATNKKDPDQRDYYVSNKKIEKKGFKAKVKIEEGIEELIKVFSNSKEKIINNY